MSNYFTAPGKRSVVDFDSDIDDLLRLTLLLISKLSPELKAIYAVTEAALRLQLQGAGNAAGPFIPIDRCDFPRPALR